MGEKSKSKGCFGWFLVLVLLALVVGAIVYTIKKKTSHSDKPAPVPGPPGAVEKKYAEALKVAMQFFDVQKCMYRNVCYRLLNCLFGFYCLKIKFQRLFD